MQFEWAALGTDLPLEIDEAHYRDIGDPLLRYVRELTADPDVVVAVILPGDRRQRPAAAFSTTSARST